MNRALNTIPANSADRSTTMPAHTSNVISKPNGSNPHRLSFANVFIAISLVMLSASANAEIKFEVTERSQPAPIMIIGSKLDAPTVWSGFTKEKDLLAIGDPRLLMPGAGQNRHPFKFYPGDAEKKLAPSYQAFEIDYRPHAKITMTDAEFESARSIIASASLRCPVYIYTDMEGTVIEKIKATCRPTDAQPTK